MIVVAYLYNKNGMASWCIEAAYALQQAGKDVVLIKASNVKVPANFPVRVIDFDFQVSKSDNSIYKKIWNKLDMYYQILPFVKRVDGFLPALHAHLHKLNIDPTCYLLNQTSIVNKSVVCSQYVVAWAYKPSLKDYIRKAVLLSTTFTQYHKNIYNAIFWFKIDWDAYKNATGVLAVSKELTFLLLEKKIRTSTVYPGTRGDGQLIKTENKIIRFAVMALDIDDARKGFAKIISKLKLLDPTRFELILIGGCSESFKDWVKEGGFQSSFTGLLGREEGIAILNTCDILLFGSVVDDWGFVQVEAMSRGLAVLSPNVSPFNEIIGRDDYLFNAENEEDLHIKLQNIISKKDIQQDKAWFRERYEREFSSAIFAKNLLEAITVNLNG